MFIYINIDTGGSLGCNLAEEELLDLYRPSGSKADAWYTKVDLNKESKKKSGTQKPGMQFSSGTGLIASARVFIYTNTKTGGCLGGNLSEEELLDLYRPSGSKANPLHRKVSLNKEVKRRKEGRPRDLGR